MLDYIIAGVIGIVVYQIVCAIVYIATKENDEILSIMCMFVPLGIFRAITLPIRKIVLMWCRRNLNVYCFHWTNEDGSRCHPLTNWYATDKAVANLTQDKTHPYYIEKVAEGRTFKSIPFKQDIYKGQPYFKGWDMSKFMK